MDSKPPFHAAFFMSQSRPVFPNPEVEAVPNCAEID